MKKLLLLLFTISISVQTFAQNPELFTTWHLVSYSMDLGETVYIADIAPFIDPTLVIADDLSFSGLVCNEYGGQFIYDANSESFDIDFYGACLCGTCINPPDSYIELEEDYFGYFGFPSIIEYEIYPIDTNGNNELRLEFAPGFDLVYSDELRLSVNQNIVENLFKIYPNPANTVLYVSSENMKIESFVIYSVIGEKVISADLFKNPIDISPLAKGVYFLKLISDKGTSVAKFIKE